VRPPSFANAACLNAQPPMLHPISLIRTSTQVPRALHGSDRHSVHPSPHNSLQQQHDCNQQLGMPLLQCVP
jgi:hypothetical protein